ncbi:hypothetical protein [Methanobrevibacter sp.]|uniref:hypothetical protein n=1 Tax=Methanobrevibacter sp. TaxID=66852 RepID=UPI0038655F66
MDIREVKTNLNTVVRYNGVDYMFQGCTILKNTATNEIYYQAELADLKARSVLITKLSDVKKIMKD